MKNNLISALLQRISPQSIADALDLVIRKMAERVQNEQIIYVYNILYSASCLIKRYKTILGEVILIASIEEDDKKLRERIIELSRNALHNDIVVTQIHTDNT